MSFIIYLNSKNVLRPKTRKIVMEYIEEDKKKKKTMKRLKITLLII